MRWVIRLFTDLFSHPSLSFMFANPPLGQSSPPPASAAVLEFICLFTHDLRRKQKRWQDGRLKYHTFNKRVMVYDDRGNFVGDLHWRRDYDFEEGEEIQLERGGVIVQVQDLIHRSEQDLSELLDKRAKEKEHRQAQAAARPAALNAALPRTVVRPTANGPSQAFSRPLHQIIGTPSGHHGKAVVPKGSPYDQRHQPADMPDDRAAKRRRYDDSPPRKIGHAKALFGQSLNLSATPMSSVPARRLAASQRVRHSEPGSSVETALDQVPALLGIPLQEHSKSSLLFNHQNEREEHIVEAARKETQSLQRRTDMHTKQEQNRSLNPKSSTGRQNATSISNNDDVGGLKAPPIAENNRVVKTQNPPTKLASTRHQTEEVAVAKPLERKNASKNRSVIQAADRQVCEQPSLSKVDASLGQVKKSRAKASETSGTQSATKISPNNNGLEFHANGTPRKSSRPTIELRIKSRKKRGLLLVSESRTKLSEPSSDSHNAPLATDGGTHQPPVNGLQSSIRHAEAIESEVDDDPFQFPSKSTQPNIRGHEVESEQKRSGRLATSTRLDGDAATSRHHIHQRPSREHAPPERLQRETRDFYEISSSSSEDSPGIVCETRLDPSNEDSSDGDSHLGCESRSKSIEPDCKGRLGRKTAARQTLRRRRNIVADGEDFEELPLGSSQPVVDVEKTSQSGHEMGKDVSLRCKIPKEAVSKREVGNYKKEATSKEKNALWDGLDAQDSRTSSRSTSPESENVVDRRRRSTRKRLVRPAGLEDTASDSENGPIDDETSSRKTRKKKPRKSTEERPRLTTIKKSVKSRELIGFDLTAFQAPLGTRGIGVPFSACPSHFNETTVVPRGDEAAQAGSSDVTRKTQSGQSTIRTPETSTATVQPAESAADAHAAIAKIRSDDGDLLILDNARDGPASRIEAIMTVSGKHGLPIQTSDTGSAENTNNSLAASQPRDDSALTTPREEQLGSRPQKVMERVKEANVGVVQTRKEAIIVPSAASVEDSEVTDPFMDSKASVIQTTTARLTPHDKSQLQSTAEAASSTNRDRPLVASTLGQNSNSTTAAESAQKPLAQLLRQSSTASRQSDSESRGATEHENTTSCMQNEKDAPAMIQQSRSLDPRPMNSKIQRSHKITINRPGLVCLDDSADSSTTRPARLANPASRGRKAALKSDAAGQVPQRVLPLTQAPVAVPVSTADLAGTPLERPSKVSERPKKKMTFPGFQSARGEGPWSREAYDLLETGRPQ